MHIRKLLLVAMTMTAAPCFAASTPNESTPVLKSEVAPDTAEASLAADCGGIVGRTLPYVCNRYSTGAGTASCFEAARGASYMSECALGVCDRYTTESGTTACVAAVRNRSYNAEEIQACNRLASENDTTRCMAAAGRYDGGGGMDLREVRARVSDALDLLYRQRYSSAEVELESLLQDLRTRP